MLVSQCAAAERPAPDLADASYGPHKLNTFDLWKAKSTAPAPLVAYFHGGGFAKGSKSALSANLLNKLLDDGVSVMAVDYRLSPEAHFPDHYLDCVRAIQFARAHAKAWNIDPDRIGATGSSAGGCTSLWIAFHDDLADSDNVDPILRQSSRIRCAAVFSAQSCLDPRIVGEWLGEPGKLYLLSKARPFLGIESSELNSPETFKLFEEASPIAHLTKDDPPVWAFYSQTRTPLPALASPSEVIHHVTFGLRLKEEMDDLGVECSIVRADAKAKTENAAQFFKRHLSAP